jgi:hypothetical protein
MCSMVAKPLLTYSSFHVFVSYLKLNASFNLVLWNSFLPCLLEYLYCFDEHFLAGEVKLTITCAPNQAIPLFLVFLAKIATYLMRSYLPFSSPTSCQFARCTSRDHASGKERMSMENTLSASWKMISMLFGLADASFTPPSQRERENWNASLHWLPIYSTVFWSSYSESSHQVNALRRKRVS